VLLSPVLPPVLLHLRSRLLLHLLLIRRQSVTAAVRTIGG
jgi:hypothetical protein